VIGNPLTAARLKSQPYQEANPGIWQAILSWVAKAKVWLKRRQGRWGNKAESQDNPKPKGKDKESALVPRPISTPNKPGV
jgi:hypothetical protein